MATGCQQEAPPELQIQRTNMRPLGILYGKFQRQNRGRPPQDEQQFRQFIEQSGATGQDAEEVDQLFQSPRNGAPLVVLYGTPGPMSDGGFPYVAYESQPVGGTRLVTSARGHVVEMPEAEFQELFPEAN